MDPFWASNSTEEDTMAGAVLPRFIVDYLDLYAFLTQVSRSHIIRTVLIHWVMLQMEKEVELSSKSATHSLVSSIITQKQSQLISELSLLKDSEKIKYQKKFFEDLQDQLEKRKIRGPFISEIIQGVKDGTENVRSNQT